MFTDHVFPHQEGKYLYGLKLNVVFTTNLMVSALCEKREEILLVLATCFGPVIQAYNLRQETRVFPCRASVYTGASDMSL